MTKFTTAECIEFIDELEEFFISEKEDGQIIQALRAQLTAAQEMAKAAEGLSHGADWNNGTHAKMHGYRQKLLDALTAWKDAGGK